MKVILEFDTEEDGDAYAYAVHGLQYASTLQDIDAELKNQIKYGGHSGKVENALQKIRDALHEAADVHDVKVWG